MTLKGKNETASASAEDAARYSKAALYIDEITTKAAVDFERIYYNFEGSVDKMPSCSITHHRKNL